MMNINKTVIITGSSRGIGYETAKEFAKYNYNIVLNYNKSKKNNLKLIKEIKNINNNLNIISLKADISKYEACEFLINKSIQEFGKIDILINNAGISEKKLFTEISLKEWRKMFSVNMESMFNCTQLSVKNMLKFHSGKIINISSIWGMVGASCEVHYSASKAAVIGFTKALAKELGPSNIQVNCVAPGVINTDMINDLEKNDIEYLKSQTPLGRLGNASDIAKTIVFLASDDSNFITGQIISPNGGFVI